MPRTVECVVCGRISHTASDRAPFCPYCGSCTRPYDPRAQHTSCASQNRAGAPRRRHRVFVCSAYRGDIEANVAAARSICRRLALSGITPIAPHLIFPQFLRDDLVWERDQGIKLGLDLLSTCDELWYYGDRITDGMRTEIAEARRLHIPVVHKTL